MHIQPSLLWTWNRTIDRVPYLLTGAILFLVKFAIDWTIATQGFGLDWSPLNYLIWPNDRVLRVFELGDSERWFSLTMLLVSLPFIWVGVILSLHRLRATGLPLILIMFFFVPLVNLLLFLILILLPTQESVPVGVVPQAVPRRFEPLRRVHRNIVRKSYWRSGLVALAVTVPCAVLGVVLGAEVLQSYGFSLFIGAPFTFGMISVLLFGFSRPQPLGACLVVAMTGSVLAGIAVLIVALEGAICLIMAAPIAFSLALLGAFVGFAIQSRPWLNDQAASVTLAVLVVLPTLMAAESANEPEPTVRAVSSEVIIDAPLDKVWPHVIAFPPLPEPDDWFFQTGIAYPQRAEIHGLGVGAVRHCIFSTGTFIEPIEDWNPPSLLRFGVSEQPEPMREWSPYRIHPAHLNHYLQSRKGQFLLEALPDGRTRLVGTTWYSNRMWPEAYWNLWSDYIIHRIHCRVLTHIQRFAEAPEEKLAMRN
ncbi:MAG TPA: hypothetical protein VG122_25910 [Gemmata sp.]|jgi:uncharacterized membrane protein YhaH (DUF805 family)|nr:hypothetical protein [Gemmata sp.]